MATHWIDALSEERDDLKIKVDELQKRIDKVLKLIYILEEPPGSPLESLSACDIYGGNMDDAFDGGRRRGIEEGKYSLGQEIQKILES